MPEASTRREDIRFDQVGVWRVTVSSRRRHHRPADAGVELRRARASPRCPPRATEGPAHENLTMDSEGVKPVAIDSRAQDGEPIPDPELHEWTIADAIAQQRPVLVLFATPVYCMSQFCGPTVEALQQLAPDYPDKAVFIHVEIWTRLPEERRERGAADWLYRDDDLTEPWLYLIDADGRDRRPVGAAVRPRRGRAALDALPADGAGMRERDGRTAAVRRRHRRRSIRATATPTCRPACIARDAAARSAPNA